MAFDFGKVINSIGANAANAAEELGKATAGAAATIADATATAAAAATDAATIAANTITDAASSVAAEVDARIQEGKAEKVSEYQNETLPVREALAGTDAEHYLDLLGESPVALTKDEAAKAIESFPIPREQHVLWMDAEFDLRPSGIVATEAGVYVKTDVSAINLPGEGSGEKKSKLYYFRWDNFDPAWFEDCENQSNLALTVDEKCSTTFIERCKNAAIQDEIERQKIAETCASFDRAAEGAKLGAIAGAAAESAQNAVLLEQKAAVNLAAGHGEMAEEAITALDRLHGLDARVTGRDNAKNGDDRRIRELGIDKVFIQTKYCKKWRSSLEASFENGGNYRYYDEFGKPMQLEVPKDQYRQVVEGFKIKIKQGKVPGVTDPEQATQIVRKGRLTYESAKNLTKPGTIESLGYDALTGAVTCSCAFGITFVATTYLTWRKTGNLEDAIQAGMAAGIQVFGLTFIQHMLVSQVARTSLAKSLVAPSEALVGKLGKDATQTIVKGLRALAGKNPIYGAAATKHLAKMARSTALTTAITLVVFSIPETYNLVQRKISTSQYAKNMSMLVAGTAAGVAGGVAAGVAAAKVAGLAGTAVAPGVGTAVGVAGGFVGGTVGTLAAGAIGDVLHEGDTVLTGRLFNAVLTCMISEYLLDEKEIDAVVDKMSKVNDKELAKLFEDVFRAESQEDCIRAFLVPMFDEVAAARPKFKLPDDEALNHALEEAFNEGREANC